MSLNVEGYIKEGIASKIQGEEGKEDELGNNSLEMTKKYEGKNQQLHKNLKEQKEVRGQEKFMQYGIISL